MRRLGVLSRILLYTTENDDVAGRRSRIGRLRKSESANRYAATAANLLSRVTT